MNALTSRARDLLLVKEELWRLGWVLNADENGYILRQKVVELVAGVDPDESDPDLESLYGSIASKIWGIFLSFFGPFGPIGPFGHYKI